MNSTYTKQLRAEGEPSLQAEIDIGCADDTAKQAADEDSAKRELMRLFRLVGVDGEWLRAVRMLASSRAGQNYEQIITRRDRRTTLPHTTARWVLPLPGCASRRTSRRCWTRGLCWRCGEERG